jgi:glyoxylase-like metal-dependent hydrolase (beta-lactamase superfamily II)
MKCVIQGVHVIPMRMAHAFLIEGDDGLALIYQPDERLEPETINELLSAGEILSIAAGFDVIHTPGHCAGQVALLWRPGRMLFAGDVRMDIMGFGDPVGFESLESREPEKACRSFIRRCWVRAW